MRSNQSNSLRKAGSCTAVATDPFTVQSKGRPQFESMSALLAFLAYPLAPKLRLQFERSLVFQFARDTAKRRPDWGKNVFISADRLPPYDAESRVIAGCDILEHERLLAGDIALGYALMAANRKPRLGKERFGVATVMGVASAQGAFKSHATGYSYWKASRPVVHLAVAYKLIRQSCASGSLYDLIETIGSAEETIEAAAHIKILLLSLSGTRGGPTAIPDFRSFGMIDIAVC